MHECSAQGKHWDNWVRIVFNFEQDEYGYPPYTSEGLLARPLACGTYELANIPVFARQVSLGDVVAADEIGGEIVFRRLVKRAGHSTVRVLLPLGADSSHVLRPLEELGCLVRETPVVGLFAVDVPPEADYAKVAALLEEGEEKEIWGYEESSTEEERLESPGVDGD
jgi:hypothetical protein